MGFNFSLYGNTAEDWQKYCIPAGNTQYDCTVG
jgi:hypothetical protein